jgi:ribosomal protein S18 acetylase RimI-like enzyme
VEPAYRQQGIFSRLYQHLHRLAHEDPTVVGLRLYVERDNAPAHSVYEKLGMARAGYFVMQDIFAPRHNP